MNRANEPREDATPAIIAAVVAGLTMFACWTALVLVML